MLKYFNKAAKPISAETWYKLLGDMEYCSVKAQRTPGQRYFISTVWLGIDHGGQAGKPIIFETIVFGDRQSLFTARYHSLTEARLGHRRIYAQYAKRDRLKIDDIKKAPAKT